MNASLTVAQALDQARRILGLHSETAALDAQVLLAEIIHRDQVWLLAHPEGQITEQERGRLAAALERSRQGEALPYILEWWEFYGRRFQINRHVLIPRPETELLVDAALRFLRSGPPKAHVIDVGTGCGCIAVTLAAEMPDLRMAATDISWPALQVARLNAVRHGVQERVLLVQTDLSAGIAGPVDLICANLPYVASPALAYLEVGRREPTVALDGGKDGLALVRRLLAELPSKLAPGGQALLEIGADQGRSSRAAAVRAIPHAHASVERDAAGRDRLLLIQM